MMRLYFPGRNGLYQMLSEVLKFRIFVVYIYRYVVEYLPHYIIYNVKLVAAIKQTFLQVSGDQPLYA